MNLEKRCPKEIKITEKKSQAKSTELSSETKKVRSQIHSKKIRRIDDKQKN